MCQWALRRGTEDSHRAIHIDLDPLALQPTIRGSIRTFVNPTSPLMSPSAVGVEGGVVTGEIEATVSMADSLKAAHKELEAAVTSEVVPNEISRGSRLRRQKDHWSFYPWAQNIVSKGLYWTWQRPPPPLKRFFQKETPLLKAYVRELLDKSLQKPDQ